MQTKKVAVVLAGAVAKGAYQAGVLKVLAESGLEVTRLVAASSGALNAAMYAWLVRAGREREGADRLIDLWRDEASLLKVFALDPRALVRMRGASSMRKLRAIMKQHLEAGLLASPRPVSLRILVSPLDGIDSHLLDRVAEEGEPAPAPLPPPKSRTTYEYACDFVQTDFDTVERRDRIVTAALASAAFPGAFTPVVVEHPAIGTLGPCIDGGAVNNTPIKWAIGGPVGDELDAVIVIAPSVERVRNPPDELRGIALVNQVAQMLIDERLYRDLREAERINAQLASLQGLVSSGRITPAQLADVKRALGWTKMRRLQIIQIRPLEGLRGNAFSAFASASLRTEYIEEGIARARAVIGHPDHLWLTSPNAPAPAGYEPPPGRAMIAR